jgi:hypothetical protein
LLKLNTAMNCPGDRVSKTRPSSERRHPRHVPRYDVHHAAVDGGLGKPHTRPWIVGVARPMKLTSIRKVLDAFDRIEVFRVGGSHGRLVGQKGGARRSCRLKKRKPSQRLSIRLASVTSLTIVKREGLGQRRGDLGRRRRPRGSRLPMHRTPLQGLAWAI